MRKPDTFIVGVPRAGTTSLYHYLGEHPEFFMPPIKSPSCFGDEPNSEYPHFHKNIDAYLSLYKGAGQAKRLGDATHYFHSETAPREIKEFNPDAKIIISLRNPVDILYSRYRILVNRGKTDKSFREFLDDERLSKDAWANVKYPENIQRFLSVFGRDNVYFILFDELKENPLAAYRGLCRFLGISEDFHPSFDVFNPQKKRNMWILYLVRTLPSGFRMNLKTMLPNTLYRFYIDILNRVTSSKNSSEMDYELRQELTKMFSPMIKKTGELIGKDLSSWLSDGGD